MLGLIALACCSCRNIATRSPADRDSLPVGATANVTDESEEPGVQFQVRGQSPTRSKPSTVVPPALSSAPDLRRTDVVDFASHPQTNHPANVYPQAVGPQLSDCPPHYTAPFHGPIHGSPHGFAQLPADAMYQHHVEQDGSWRPPGMSGPWPEDEYVFDGGDDGTPVKIAGDWTVGGLDYKDTVGHFDTLDGETVVSPSNRVSIYAPRFAAVRKVYGFAMHEAHDKSAGVELAAKINLHEDLQIATTALQRIQAQRQTGTRRLSTFRDQTRGLDLFNRQRVTGLSDGFLPYENLQLIRIGEYEQTEKARLSQAIDAALVWESKQAVQVTVKGVEVAIERGLAKPQETLRFDRPDGKPQLRVIKIASAAEAKPGDEIDFTIRFDNLGTEVIGNVTIIDNLTARLEYVADSAQCDLAANFATVDNEGQSLILRWEIAEPMQPGKGGIIRFKCRVR